MSDRVTWVHAHFRDLAIAAAVAIAVSAVLLWLRRLVNRWLRQQEESPSWTGLASTLLGLRRVSSLWILLLAAYPAVHLLPLPSAWRSLIARLLLTALLLSIGIAAIGLVRGLFRRAGERFDLPRPALRVGIGVLSGAVALSVVIATLDVWGASAVPLLAILLLAMVLSAVGLRDILPTVVASLQVMAFKDLHQGDYIKLDSGEEGTIEVINWRKLVLRAVDGSCVDIPYPKLVRATLVNYGRPLRRAKAPLRFQVRSHIREITGLRAQNLRELGACLRAAPDDSIYYHTHQYLEEHQYLTPTPANAFSEWVSVALGNEAVAEALAAIDIMDAPAIGALRERLVATVENAIEAGKDTRQAEPGQELHFLKSITFVTPAPYEASNLRELAGVVRRLSLGSLYFHLFEARLLGGAAALGDIPNWLRRELDEPELASAIDRLNPYDYTVEGLRAWLLSRIEAKLA